MGFTELSHAFIAAKYYVYLKEIFGDRGEAAFLHATRYYGEQRGRRMAQRAIRDGKPLTYETYCQYGEWVNTEEVKAQGLGNQSETTSLSPADHVVYGMAALGYPDPDTEIQPKERIGKVAYIE